MEGDKRASFGGLRVLVAEDEAVVALDLEFALRGLGCEVLGPTASVAHTLELLGQERPDAVFLDFHLVDGPALPVAETLRTIEVPFILATGKTADELEHPALQRVPRLEKPYGDDEVRQALVGLLGRY